MHLYLTYPDNEIDFKNTTNPFKPYLRTEDILFTYEAKNAYVYSFRKTILYSDFGFVFEEEYDLDSYQSELTQSVTLYGSTFFIPEAYGTVSISMPIEATFHRRSYIKLQAIVANIGGVVNFVMLLAKINSVYFSSKFVLIEYVNNRLVDFKHEDINLLILKKVIMSLAI